MIEIRHKKEVDYEVVDTLNSEQNGVGGGKGSASPPKSRKHTWIAAAVLAVAIITLILLSLNGR